MGNPGNSLSNQRPKQPDYGPPRVLIKQQYGVCPQSEHPASQGFRHNAGAKPPAGHATCSSARGCPGIEVWERSELGMATWIQPTDTGNAVKVVNALTKPWPRSSRGNPAMSASCLKISVCSHQHQILAPPARTQPMHCWGRHKASGQHH